MWGHYSARGQIGTVPVRAALAGPAWALHSIVGWETTNEHLLYASKLSEKNSHNGFSILRFIKQALKIIYKDKCFWLTSALIRFLQFSNIRGKRGKTGRLRIIANISQYKQQFHSFQSLLQSHDATAPTNKQSTLLLITTGNEG